MRGFWRQAIEVARVDLVVERRLGETLRIVVPFAVVAAMVFPLAIGFSRATLQEVGIGMYWAIAIFFGMMIALRQSASDTQERRDLQQLLGLDPAARFVGRVASGSLLTVGFLAALFAATLVFSDPDIPAGGWGVIAGASLLLAPGLTALGVLAGEITTGLRNRSALASLIVAPLALPLVIGASQSVEGVTRDAGILPWTLLLVATDLGLMVAGVALARPLEEATR